MSDRKQIISDLVAASSWLQTIGVLIDLDPWMVVDHRCCTPACVNPAHLQQITNQQNLHLQQVRRKRCHRGHEYTEENTLWYARKPSSSNRNPDPNFKTRMCRACNKLAVQRREDRMEAAGLPRTTRDTKAINAALGALAKKAQVAS